VSRCHPDPLGLLDPLQTKIPGAALARKLPQTYQKYHGFFYRSTASDAAMLVTVIQHQYLLTTVQYSQFKIVTSIGVYLSMYNLPLLTSLSVSLVLVSLCFSLISVHFVRFMLCELYFTCILFVSSPWGFGSWNVHLPHLPPGPTE